MRERVHDGTILGQLLVSETDVKMMLTPLSVWKTPDTSGSSIFEDTDDFAYLFRMDFDLVVGRGDDDVFRREVLHVNCELVWVTEGLDISSPT